MRKDTIERRKRILNAAIECYKELGVQFSSLEKVADTAGVTRPTVYAHFQSKENLFAEVMEIIKEAYDEQPLPRYKTGECVKAQLISFFKAYVANVINPENMKLYRAVIMEIARVGDRGPSHEEFSDEGQLKTWLNDARDDGAIRDVDVDIVAMNLIALVDGHVFWPSLNCVRDYGSDEINEILEKGLGSYVEHLIQA